MSRFNLKPGPSGPHPGRAGLHPSQGRHPHRHHRRGRLIRRRRRGNRLEPATGRMQQTPTAPYPVGALCCNSGRGVAIGTATEILALQHQHSGVHQGRTGAGLSVKVITVRYHPLRREFSLTEGPAPGTRSCLGSLAAASAPVRGRGMWLMVVTSVSHAGVAVVIHRPCHRSLRGGSLRGRRGGQSPR